MIKRLIEKLKTLRLYFVMCGNKSDIEKVLDGLSDNNVRCKNWCGMKWCDKNDCINVSKGFSDETDKTYYTYNTDKKLHISDVINSKIYCGFVINDREQKNHSTMIHKFLSENNLQTKTLNSYYDEDGECTWYIVSDKNLTDDDFLVELDKLMEDDTNYYGHL